MPVRYKSSQSPLSVFKAYVYGVVWSLFAAQIGFLFLMYALPFFAIGGAMLVVLLGTWLMAPKLTHWRYVMAFWAGWWLLALACCWWYAMMHSVGGMNPSYSGPPLLTLFLVVASYAATVGALIACSWYVHRRVYGLPLSHRANDICEDCGYDLTANESGTCSECGRPIERDVD